MRKKPIIHTVSYVHSKDGGLIRFDDLTPEQKRKAATELKCRLLNGMFQGVAHFYPASEDAER